MQPKRSTLKNISIMYGVGLLDGSYNKMVWRTYTKENFTFENV